jgi:hypothetical protein
LVRQAEEVMGLMGSEADSGRGSMVVKEGREGTKKKEKTKGIEVEAQLHA